MCQKPSKLLKFFAFGLIILAFFSLDSHLFADERFSEFEIRVIRPRFFVKRNHFELGIQTIAVTNQTFIYTYMLSGILTYHISEQIGIELSAAIGTSIDKEDKVLLQQDFEITTQIIRTKTMFMSGVLWTPIYGKYQLASGELVYFDTFLSGYFGMTGIDYQYEHCLPQPGVQLKDPQVIQYPTFAVGVGQRFFLSRSSSFRWDIREQLFTYSSSDGACTDDVEGTDIIHNNITIQLGYSMFL